MAYASFLNVLSVSFVILILYFFFVNLNLNSFLSKTNLLGCLISFVVSGLISSFVLNNFKYSKYFIIRILQRFVIYTILFTVIGYIFGGYVYCDNGDDNTSPTSGGSENMSADYNTNNNEIASITTTNEGNNGKYVIKVDKDIANKDMESSVKVAKVLGTEFAPNFGAAAAAGSAASATIRATAGMPIPQRVGLVAGSAFVTATSTQLGLKAGTALFNQSSISDITKNIKPTDVDNGPSPDSSFINCVCLHNRKR